MAILQGRYYTLPHLDVTDQPTISSGTVNKLKSPLREAVNDCRQNDTAMNELINILEETLVHINQHEKERKAKMKTQRPRSKNHSKAITPTLAE